MRMLYRSGASALCFAALAIAGDFWAVKPSSEWTEKEVKKILNQSPWAIRAGYEGLVAPAANAMALTQDSSFGARTSATTAAVRWISAEPLRSHYEALGLPAKTVASWADEHYVVMISDVYVPGDKDAIGERVRAGASLNQKGQAPVPAARVEVLPADIGVTLAFLFPRSAALDMTAREIMFESTRGVKLKARFDLQRMVYDGKPAL